MFTPYLPAAMLDARTSGQRGPFSSDDGVAQLLPDAGLVDVRTAHRTVEAVFRDAEHLLEFSWSHGQRALSEAVPEQEHSALREQITATAADHIAGGSGQLSYTRQIRHTLGSRPFEPQAERDRAGCARRIRVLGQETRETLLRQL